MITESKLDLYFEQLWSSWINKDRGENAAKKALKVLLNQGEDFKRIKEACSIYCITRANDEYTHQLGNFLLQDHWKDILEETSIEKIQQRRDEEINLINKWNESCRPHWCKVVEYDSKYSMARQALNNKFFNENWKEALDKAVKIFFFSFREEDNRSKIILSFKWFTTVKKSHTVSRLIEGEYGSPAFSMKVKPVEIKPIDWEARKAAAEYLKKLMLGEEEYEDEDKTTNVFTGSKNNATKSKGIDEHPFD
jgi:hypothetical protein